MPVDASTAKGRLLLVDDDALFRESLGQNLLDEGYLVDSVDGGEPALAHLANDGTVDAVLLDWRMPGLDGLAVLRLMREREHTMPVLFLTALTDNVYEEAALALGAVDFISKSRSLSVILQRLSLIVEGRKRYPNSSSDPLIRGKLELRPPIGRAFWDGHRVELTLTEFTILQTLAETPKRDFSYREIYDIVRGKGFIAGWGEEGYRVNVRSFIKRIRQKFRAIDDAFDCIKNYSGYGYYWDHGE
ncbi:MAG: two-component system, OmpR family, response regulator ChvI [Rhodospirillaceae bacterium]|jgi:two-component system response regulator ChvI|nr:two-component system, OmpR family, response regulator ChvI [Rhodospirillaceae bacterium]